MRRAALVAGVLCLSALAVAPHAAAQAGACMDGFDNDGDGKVDWPADPGCTGPGDPDERPCGVDRLGQCTTELQPCPGMLPPTGLHATWTDQGILLEWTAPASGAPPVYLVFRVPAGEESPPPGDVTLAVTAAVSPDAVQSPLDQAHVSTPRGLAPVATTPHVPGGGDSITVVASLPLDAATDVPEPIDSVPGWQTDYLDHATDPTASYVYWVQGAGPGCRGPASNAAFAGPYLILPPDTDDCFYYEPPDHWTGPSTRCLGHIP